MSALYRSLLLGVVFLALAGPGRAQGPSWTALELLGEFRLLHVDGRIDVLQSLGSGRLQRLHGGTGKVVWTRGLTRDEQPSLPPKIEGQPDWTYILRSLEYISRECPDLNEDKYGDLLLTPRNAPDLVAVSGKDGAILWWYRSNWHPWRATLIRGALAHEKDFVVGPPLFADVDGDGVPDVLALFSNGTATYSYDGKQLHYPEQTRVQAISGRSGELLWSYTLGGPRTRPAPGDGPEPQPLTLHRWQGRPVVTVYADEQFVTLDLLTGKPLAEPIRFKDLRPGEKIVSQLRYFDPYGTGELAALIQGSEKTVALSVVEGKILWEAGLRWATKGGASGKGFDWPLLADLGGDDKPDLFLPFREEDTKNRDTAWYGLERFDGRTGRSVWRHRLYHLRDPDHTQQNIARLIAGPDLNGDGVRDLFAILELKDHPGWEGVTNDSNDYWRAPGPTFRVGVCALSGADGSPFWQQESAEEFTNSSGDLYLDPPHWWRPAAQLRRQLVVPRSKPLSINDSGVWILDPVMGKLRAVWGPVVDVGVTDFAGDGQRDLYGSRPNRWNPSGKSEGGELLRFTGLLATYGEEGGVLPPDAPAYNLPPMEPPWARRALPWAEVHRRGRNALALTFVLPLGALLALRWYKTALLLFLAAPAAGAAWSWYLLSLDVPLEPDQHYRWFDWYGAAAWVIVWFSLVVSAPLAVYWAGVGFRYWLRDEADGGERERPPASEAKFEFDPLQPPPKADDIPRGEGEKEPGA